MPNTSTSGSALRPGTVESPPVSVSAPYGSFPDDLDRFQMNGYEDPGQWEAAMKRAFVEAETDAEVAQLLKTHYLEENIAASFAAYRATGVSEAVDGLLQRLGVSRQTPIADIGCGRGHAAHAMSRIGYKNMTAMDPNDEWFTGTGYLRSLDDHQIRIINSLEEWGQLGGQFGAIISSGTVHHWQHIPQLAIETRRTMQPGGYWLMMAEYFANSARELVDGLSSHPTATRYGSFEWAYPASAYVDLIQTSGFLLVGVIPLHYKGALFYSGCSLPADEELDQWVDENLTRQDGTVEAFWSEVDSWRRGTGTNRNYTVPQVLIFQRVQT
ncbi:MAG: hypothetical protein DCF23_03160 [Cyanobium sp.]|nr:MAG: hypothetical protein DCF23_03160 [Cyanobium sp.]